MKRMLALAIPVLALVGVLIAFARLEGRRTPDWEATLNDYISRAAQRGDDIAVLSASEASRPSSFTAAMGTAMRSGGTWENVELPFPPQTLRCVLVERKRASASAVSQEPIRQVIYVAYHSDKLWHMGWLVYEGPSEPFTAQLAADLQAIGCDLDLQ